MALEIDASQWALQMENGDSKNCTLLNVSYPRCLNMSTIKLEDASILQHMVSNHTYNTNSTPS